MCQYLQEEYLHRRHMPEQSSPGEPCLVWLGAEWRGGSELGDDVRGQAARSHGVVRATVNLAFTPVGKGPLQGFEQKNNVI